MKKMVVLSLVLMGVFDAGVLGSDSGGSAKEKAPAALVKEWEVLSFDVEDLKDKSTEAIKKLKKAHKNFHCAFTVQEKVSHKYDFTKILRTVGMGSAVDGYRAVVRGHSTAAMKDFKDDGEARKGFNGKSNSLKCALGEVAFDGDWSPLKYIAPTDKKNQSHLSILCAV